MAVSFDPLTTCGPTRRSFKPGQFATKRFTSVSGAGTTRLYGSKAFDATLQMTFVLNDADTCAFMKCWDEAKGSYSAITLPAEFFAGDGSTLSCGIPDYLEWKWAEAPSVESLFPGRSRVQANFIATLDS